MAEFQKVHVCVLLLTCLKNNEYLLLQIAVERDAAFLTRVLLYMLKLLKPLKANLLLTVIKIVCVCEIGILKTYKHHPAKLKFS